MKSPQDLRRQIDSTRDLLGVTRTMKAMAAVGLRHDEDALGALSDYREAVEMGLQIVLKERPALLEDSAPAPRRGTAAVVFGSDHGMCGAFNTRMRRHILDWRRHQGLFDEPISLMCVGRRLAEQLRDTALKLDVILDAPASVDGVSAFVHDALVQLDAWRADRQVDHVWLLFSQTTDGAYSAPRAEVLLPIDRPWLERIQARAWPTRLLPACPKDVDELFSKLVQEHLFVSIFRACCASRAAENYARLSSMQSAERNIKTHLDDLHTAYRRTRQSNITAELLDIIAGYEALADKES